jgi:hypothetical protein
MNQFFSLQRFSLLVSKHWADNKKRYSLSVLAFIGLLIGWFLFFLLVEKDAPMDKGMQFITFLFSLFVIGSFYASQYFRELSSRAKGINFLLVPASAFEKILCSILFNFVLFFVVFVSAFYIADFLMVTVSNSFLDSSSPENKQGLINVFQEAKLPFDGTNTINLLAVFFSIQAFFLLGSVYFEKYSFIKTVISGFLIFLALFFFIFFLFELMPNGGYTSGFLTSFHIQTGDNQHYLVSIPNWIGKSLFYLLMYGTAPFLWIVTYYRLKEKQV